jgi:transposase InsO family protein
MGAMPTANYPGQLVALDIVGPLPTAPTGSKYLLTILDHASGWADALPLQDKTSQSVQNAFHENWLPRFTVPEVIITDNGMEFNSNAIKTYFAEIGSEHRNTTPYHPQSNGKIGRSNPS